MGITVTGFAKSVACARASAKDTHVGVVQSAGHQEHPRKHGFGTGLDIAGRKHGSAHRAKG
eukprot:12630419-Alexandrium_andersonii.AAC.1